jgi:membrane protease YdiL (CAAX protease family)
MDDHRLFMTLGILAALLASGLAWIVVLFRVRAGQPLLAHEPRRDVPWGLVDLLIAVVVLLATQLFAFRLVSKRYGLNLDSDLLKLTIEQHGSVIVAGAISTLATVVVSLSLVMLHTGSRVREVGFDARRLWHDLRLGVAAFVMLAPLVYLIQFVLVQWFESKHPLIQLLKEKPDSYLFGVIVFSAVVVAPIAEEYLFRVLLQGWLEKAATFGGAATEIVFGRSPFAAKPAGGSSFDESANVESADAGEYRADDNPYVSPRNLQQRPNSAYTAEAAEAGGWSKRPPTWPILVSAIIFAAMHASHGPDPIPLFVLAVGLGFLYQRTHRILPCMILHALLNGCSMLLLWIDIHLGLT